MNTIKIGIVEDEVIIADTIISALESLGYDTTEPCMTYTQALEMVENEKPDLILLDIQLAGSKTGIDVAEVLNREYNIPFIFLTSNADAKTIAEAKEVNPHAYLVKPFNKDDLFTSIEIALSNYSKQNLQQNTSPNVLKDSLFVKKKDRFHSIKFADIIFIKSEHVYMELNTANDAFLVRSTTEDLLNKLPQGNFFQVHRRYIINLNYLQEIDSEVVVVGGYEVPLSKTFRADLMKLANLL